MDGSKGASDFFEIGTMSQKNNPLFLHLSWITVVQSIDPILGILVYVMIHIVVIILFFSHARAEKSSRIVKKQQPTEYISVKIYDSTPW